MDSFSAYYSIRFNVMPQYMGSYSSNVKAE